MSQSEVQGYRLSKKNCYFYTQETHTKETNGFHQERVAKGKHIAMFAAT